MERSDKANMYVGSPLRINLTSEDDLMDDSDLSDDEIDIRPTYSTNANTSAQYQSNLVQNKIHSGFLTENNMDGLSTRESSGARSLGKVDGESVLQGDAREYDSASDTKGLYEVRTDIVGKGIGVGDANIEIGKSKLEIDNENNGLHESNFYPNLDSFVAPAPTMRLPTFSISYVPSRESYDFQINKLSRIVSILSIVLFVTLILCTICFFVDQMWMLGLVHVTVLAFIPWTGFKGSKTKNRQMLTVFYSYTFFSFMWGIFVWLYMLIRASIAPVRAVDTPESTSDVSYGYKELPGTTLAVLISYFGCILVYFLSMYYSKMLYEILGVAEVTFIRSRSSNQIPSTSNAAQRDIPQNQRTASNSFTTF